MEDNDPEEPEAIHRLAINICREGGVEDQHAKAVNFYRNGEAKDPYAIITVKTGKLTVEELFRYASVVGDKPDRVWVAHAERYVENVGWVVDDEIFK